MSGLKNKGTRHRSFFRPPAPGRIASSGSASMMAP